MVGGAGGYCGEGGGGGSDGCGVSKLKFYLAYDDPLN